MFGPIGYLAICRNGQIVGKVALALADPMEKTRPIKRGPLDEF